MGPYVPKTVRAGQRIDASFSPCYYTHLRKVVENTSIRQNVRGYAWLPPFSVWGSLLVRLWYGILGFNVPLDTV